METRIKDMGPSPVMSRTMVASNPLTSYTCPTAPCWSPTLTLTCWPGQIESCANQEIQSRKEGRLQIGAMLMKGPILLGEPWMLTRCYETTPIFFSFHLLYSILSRHVIVMWLHSDSIVPVTPIVLVTPLFLFTISTSSLWPYSLRLDFCILWYRQAIRVLSPLSSLAPFHSRYSL